jgi:hypothetical protein
MTKALVLYWQQWYVLAVAAVSLLLMPMRPTLLLKLAGIGWTLIFLLVLWSAGFFTGGERWI